MSVESRDALAVRLMSWTVVVEDCWHWIGCLTHDGYGIVKVGGRGRAAHRVSYEAFVGPIPDGLTLDHLCRRRECINPAHLEPVTLKENCSRGFYATKKLCANGHPLDGISYNIKNGRRMPRRECITCRNARARAYQRRKAAASGGRS